MTEVKVGMKFTRLTVVSQFKNYKKWNCICECGSETIVTQSGLLNGNKKSCGCLKRDILISRNTTHGMSNLPEYSNWKDMIKRCFNKNNKRYKYYGERGISVHNDFVKDFSKWLDEIGRKPQDGQEWSIGRIDNNDWYTYGNMRWELDTTQARNHSKQSNNTSGITGVKFRKRLIGNKYYSIFTATWNQLDGTVKSKDFSADKYGYDKAKQLAIDYRNKMIKELNDQGAGYADSHGSEK